MQLCNCNCNLQLSLSWCKKNYMLVTVYHCCYSHCFRSTPWRRPTSRPTRSTSSSLPVLSAESPPSALVSSILSKNSSPKANCRVAYIFLKRGNFLPHSPIVDKEEYRAIIGHQTINITWCLQGQCWGSPPSCCPSWSPRCRSARTRRAGWPPSVTSASCSGPWPPVFWPGSLVEFLQ